MGYFSNGSEGSMYESKYCERCVHYQGGICPVLTLHMEYNYKECNNPDSMLHVLIPRVIVDKETGYRQNAQCTMFHEAKEKP